jgi:hypothetical protein
MKTTIIMLICLLMTICLYAGHRNSTHQRKTVTRSPYTITYKGSHTQRHPTVYLYESKSHRK